MSVCVCICVYVCMLCVSVCVCVYVCVCEWKESYQVKRRRHAGHVSFLVSPSGGFASSTGTTERISTNRMFKILTIHSPIKYRLMKLRMTFLMKKRRVKWHSTQTNRSLTFDYYICPFPLIVYTIYSLHPFCNAPLYNWPLVLRPNTNWRQHGDQALYPTKLSPKIKINMIAWIAYDQPIDNTLITLQTMDL